MTRPLKQFAARAFARPGVKKAFRELDGEFAFIDEVLRAYADALGCRLEIRLVKTKQRRTTKSKQARRQVQPPVDSRICTLTMPTASPELME